MGPVLTKPPAVMGLCCGSSMGACGPVSCEGADFSLAWLWGRAMGVTACAKRRASVPRNLALRRAEDMAPSIRGGVYTRIGLKIERLVSRQANSATKSLFCNFIWNCETTD